MKNKLLLGALCAVLSAAFYAVQTAVIKVNLQQLSIPLIVFFQSLICLLLILPLVFSKKKQVRAAYWVSSEVKRYHIVRAISSLAISYFLFAALHYMPLFDSLLLFNAFPLFVPIIAYFLLGLAITRLVWLFLLLGFIGIALVLNPDSKVLSFAAGFGLLSAASAALTTVAMRKIAVYDDAIKSLFIYFVISTLISAVVVLSYWHWSSVDLFSVIVIGVLFFLVQYFFTLSTIYTAPQVTASLYYSNIIFSLMISYFIFQQGATVYTLFGVLFIVGAGLGVIYLQRKKNLAPIQVNPSE